MSTGDIIYLFLMTIFIGAMLGISIFNICEGETIIGLLGIVLAITDAFDAWHHIVKWNRIDNKIKRIKKN